MKVIFKSYSSLFILLVYLCVSMQSCSREEVEPVINPREEILTRSDSGDIPETKFDVTQRMAEIFISSNKENPPIVSVEPYGIDGVTCFYIFNFEKGFKVVSADTRVSPVLAESGKENLIPAKIHDGLRVWLEDTADRIRVLKVNDIDTGVDYSDFWSNFAGEKKSTSSNTRSLDPGQDYVWIKTVEYSSTPYTIYANIPHLLETKWGQESPWNTSMPTINDQHCLTGCVAVAISQVLYYFHQMNLVPNDLWHNISISGYNLINNSITVTLSKSQYTTASNRWNLMPLSAGFAYSAYVSELMLDIGERVNMHYGLLFSSVTLDPYDFHIPNIGQCGINASYGGFSFSTIKGDLLNSKPIISIARSAGSDFHAWVIDGCEDFLMEDVTTTTYRYVAVDDIPDDPAPVATYSNEDMLRMYPNAIDGMQIVSTVYNPRQRVLMNWGYDGVGDEASYEVGTSSNWIYDNLNYKYNRNIYHNITTSQLN